MYNTLQSPRLGIPSLRKLSSFGQNLKCHDVLDAIVDVPFNDQVVRVKNKTSQSTQTTFSQWDRLPGKKWKKLPWQL